MNRPIGKDGFRAWNALGLRGRVRLSGSNVARFYAVMCVLGTSSVDKHAKQG